MSIYIFPETHTAPELVTLAKAKAHLKVDHDYEDDLIADYLAAAIEAAEGYTGININQAKWNVRSDSFLEGLVFKVGVITATEVKYLDEAGAEQVLGADKYEILPVNKVQHMIHYPDMDQLPELKENSSKAVQVIHTTGYTAATLPKGMLNAVLLILGDLYENRQDKAHTLPTRSKALLRRYRMY